MMSVFNLSRDFVFGVQFHGIRGSGFPYCRYLFGTDFTDFTDLLLGGQDLLIVFIFFGTDCTDYAVFCLQENLIVLKRLFSPTPGPVSPGHTEGGRICLYFFGT
jgi:hypothetical protein